MLEKDKRPIKIMVPTKPCAEVRARTSARICSIPVFIEEGGKLLFSREATNKLIDDMYKIFLTSYSKEDD